MGKAIWEHPIEVRLGEGSPMELLFRTPWSRFFLTVYEDDIKWIGKKQNIYPMWKVLIKRMIWENQHLSMIIYTECKDTVDNWRSMSESRISAGRTEKLRYSENLNPTRCAREDFGEEEQQNFDTNLSQMNRSQGDDPWVQLLQTTRHENNHHLHPYQNRNTNTTTGKTSMANGNDTTSDHDHIFTDQEQNNDQVNRDHQRR